MKDAETYYSVQTDKGLYKVYAESYEVGKGKFLHFVIDGEIVSTFHLEKVVYFKKGRYLFSY